MRRFFRKEKTTPFDELIVHVIDQMRVIGVASPEYPKMLALLKQLHELQTKDRRAPVSNDTIVIVAGNLLGIFAILTFERAGTITSKGLSQIMRPR